MNTNTNSNGTNTGISIHNVGPIEEFDYPMSGFGLHVLRGNQGVGKTTVLRTVQLVTDGRTDVKPTKRDGASSGEAHVAGKTVKITKRVTEEGDLAVDGLGDMNITDLHSPKFQEAHTRDKHRIKTLLRLTSVSADASLFHELLGGRERFDAIIPADSLKTDDLVEMAARIKRAIEKVAIAKEGQQQTALASMRAQASIAEDVNLNNPHDEAGLKLRLEIAIAERSQISQQRTGALEVLERAAKAKEHLRLAVTIDEVRAAEDKRVACSERKVEREADVRVLEHRLSEAKAALALAVSEEKSAIEATESIKQQRQLADDWRNDVKTAESVTCPSEDDVEKAVQAVSLASNAVELGVRIRSALAARQAADEHSETAKAHEAEAKRLRDAAKGIQDVLSNAARIEGCPLEVQYDDNGDARLVLSTDRSDDEPFDELSDGERWPHIIRIAAGSNKLIVLPQAAFGELSDNSKQQLHELAVEHRCYILTAQADDGALRGEPYKVGEAVGVLSTVTPPSLAKR